jgi:hypothetical protein
VDFFVVNGKKMQKFYDSQKLIFFFDKSYFGFAKIRQGIMSFNTCCDEKHFYQPK